MNRSCPEKTKTLFIQRKLPKGKGDSCHFHIKQPLICSDAIQPSAITSIVEHCKNEMRTLAHSNKWIFHVEISTVPLTFPMKNNGDFSTYSTLHVGNNKSMTKCKVRVKVRIDRCTKSKFSNRM